MKRSIVLLLTLSFIIGFGSARAQNKIMVDNVTGDPGADVIVKVTITSDKNIAGADFVVSFDQTKLQVKEAAKGADTGGINPYGVVDIESANADGTLEVGLIDFTTLSPMEAGEDKELYVVTFTIDAAASGVIPVEFTVIAFSDDAAALIAFDVEDGSVTVSAPPPEGNVLLIQDAAGDVGTDVIMPVLVTSDTDIAGINFTVEFDPAKLQISATAIGAAAAEIDTAGIVGIDVDAANLDGTLEVSLIDLYFTNPIVAGENQEIYIVTFTVNAEGEIPVELIGVSLSDAEAQDIEVTLVNGTVNKGTGPLVEPGDANGDGAVNIFDLLGLLEVLGGTADATAGSDANEDGATNIFDLLALLAMLTG